LARTATAGAAPKLGPDVLGSAGLRGAVGPRRRAAARPSERAV